MMNNKFVPIKCTTNKYISCKCVFPMKQKVTNSTVFLAYINKVNNDILEAQGPVVTLEGKYVDFEKEYVSFVDDKR
jgi:hypothetical protein